MAANDTRLRVAEFDFDEVKENLKIFLKAQTEFTDYDFEGAGMNIYLTLLHIILIILGLMLTCLQTKCFLIVHHYDPV